MTDLRAMIAPRPAPPAALVVIAAMVAGLVVSAGGPAKAETSAMTDAFVALAAPAYAALIEADALAEQSGSRLRAFARRDAAAEERAAAGLRGWGEATRAADIAAAHTPSIDGLGPILYPFSSVVLPVLAHGRADTEPYREALRRLTTTRGPDFDAVYRPAAAAALRRLVEAYTDYIKNGDDELLRALSVRNLPIAKRLYAEIGRG